MLAAASCELGSCTDWKRGNKEQQISLLCLLIHKESQRHVPTDMNPGIPSFCAGHCPLALWAKINHSPCKLLLVNYLVLAMRNVTKTEGDQQRVMLTHSWVMRHWGHEWLTHQELWTLTYSSQKIIPPGCHHCLLCSPFLPLSSLYSFGPPSLLCVWVFNSGFQIYFLNHVYYWQYNFNEAL